MIPSLTPTQLDETAVDNFREYLRIPSVQPDVDYGEGARIRVFKARLFRVAEGHFDPPPPFESIEHVRAKRKKKKVEKFQRVR